MCCRVSGFGPTHWVMDACFFIRLPKNPRGNSGSRLMMRMTGAGPCPGTRIVSERDLDRLVDISVLATWQGLGVGIQKYREGTVYAFVDGGPKEDQIRRGEIPEITIAGPGEYHGEFRWEDLIGRRSDRARSIEVVKRLSQDSAMLKAEGMIFQKPLSPAHVRSLVETNRDTLAGYALNVADVQHVKSPKRLCTRLTDLVFRALPGIRTRSSWMCFGSKRRRRRMCTPLLLRDSLIVHHSRGPVLRSEAAGWRRCGLLTNAESRRVLNCGGSARVTRSSCSPSTSTWQQAGELWKALISPRRSARYPSLFLDGLPCGTGTSSLQI